MGILDRVGGIFGRSRQETFARTLDRHLANFVESQKRRDHKGSLNELRALNQAVLAFVDEYDAAELVASARHWAAELAPAERVVEVATFFSDVAAMRNLLTLLEAGSSGSDGMIVLQEALNRAGIIMGPTVWDSTDGKPAADGELNPADVPAAILEVLWPTATVESEVRSRVAKAARVGTDRAAWELLGLRIDAFRSALNVAFEKDSAASRPLSNRVHELLNGPLNASHAVADPARWLQDRARLYASAAPTDESLPYPAYTAQWLANVRVAFQRALEKDDADLGLIGGTEFASALTRLIALCKRFAGS
jgi:hypothetical protein